VSLTFSYLCAVYTIAREEDQDTLWMGNLGMNRAQKPGRLILAFGAYVAAWLVFSGCAARGTFMQIAEYKPQFTNSWNQPRQERLSDEF
jgi:hypothetical protein